ncbi:MAG: hypothetical protein IPO67_31820 [Deltaproteobacteria bacterium]|nr:hypothetical protein [Deltaproteobacteria bacterium]
MSPRTHLVYVTSQPIHPSIVDYYLHLLSGVPGSPRAAAPHPDLLPRRLADPAHGEDPGAASAPEADPEAIPDRRMAHLSVFNASPLERTLSVRLGLPLYATDPGL